MVVNPAIKIFGYFMVALILGACGGDSSSPSTEDGGSSSSVIITLSSSSSVGLVNSSSSVEYGSITYEGHTYKTVVIGSQTWMAENLNFAVDSSWCYNNSADSCVKYGRLYQWASAMGIDPAYNYKVWGGSNVNHQGICPEGWHLPNDNEWQTLYDYVDANNGSEGVGFSLASGSGWAYGGNGSDLFGFSALPGGSRSNVDFFNYASLGVYFWSATETDGSRAGTRSKDDSNEDFLYASYNSKDVGLSVRCLQEESLVNGASSSSGNLSSSSYVNSAGSDNTLTDSRDGQTYKMVEMGTQTWMAENLNYAVDSSWCYNNSADSCTKYGRFYQWTSAMDIDSSYIATTWGGSNVNHQGICPEGWHLPNDNEWQTLYDYVDANNGSEGVGVSLKSTTLWLYSNGAKVGSDSFGFSAFPTGVRMREIFYENGNRAYFWSASEVSDNDASSWYMIDYSDDFYQDGRANISFDKFYGFNVRCLKNAE